MTASPRRFAARPISRLFALTLALPLALPLGGCLTSAPPPKVRSAAPVAAGSTEPIRFGEVAVGSMRRGMEIGQYVWDIDCAPPYDPVYWTSGWNMRRGSTFDERFDEALTDAGFDVVGRLGGPDLPDGGRSRAVFTVQGDLRSVRQELCNRTNWLTGAKKGVSGTSSVRVDWTIYDARSGQLVHRVTTTGTAKLDSGVPQGEVLLVEDAFVAAADRLAADPGFRAAVSRGGAVAGSMMNGGAAAGRTAVPPMVAATPNWQPVAATPASPSGGPSGTPSGTLPPDSVPLLPEPFPATNLAIRPSAAGNAADASIRVGEGRGVVIGEAGGQSVILTPAAGADATVAVHPARGVILTGTVTARDAVSGLALVVVPARLSGMALRSAAARVGEPVTLLTGQGRGRGREAATGIVGSLRPDARAGFEVIQADLPDLVADDGPAPGDPLVDEGGALLGIALGTRQPGTPPGLVPFAPVAEVLGRMGTTPAISSPAAPRRSWAAAPSLRRGLRPDLDDEHDGDGAY